MNAIRCATKILLRGEFKLKVINLFFCTQIVQFRPHAEQTDATQPCHRLEPGGGAQVSNSNDVLEW